MRVGHRRNASESGGPQPLDSGSGKTSHGDRCRRVSVQISGCGFFWPLATGSKRTVSDRLAAVRLIAVGRSRPTAGVNVGAANYPDGRRLSQPG